MMLFIWSVLTRFAKTFGCLFIIAGIGVAASFLQQRTPIINAIRYRDSGLLSERLGQLTIKYQEAQRLVLEFKGTGIVPTEHSAAEFKPQFPTRASTAQDFLETSRQLGRVGAGRDAMKAFLVVRLETLLTEIQQKLQAHAASLTPPATPAPPPPPPSEFDGLYAREVNRSEIDSRKSDLEKAKEFLDVLRTAAENPANQKILLDSIEEVTALTKLLPDRSDNTSRLRFDPKEPLNAEKVARRLAETRARIREAVLSSWALDVAFDKALQTYESEQRIFASSDARVRSALEALYFQMAAAVAAGFFVGTFFLLIGDWTAKSAAVVRDYWGELFPDFTASPGDVYQAVERSIEARRVPGLEAKRVFWHEGGAISHKREYLQLARERLAFEICASPFGTGFFVSFRSTEVPLMIDPLGVLLLIGGAGILLLVVASLFGLLWGGVILVLSGCVATFALRTAIARGLGDLDRVLMKTPLIAPIYELFLRPRTYYRIDSTEMYLKAVHAAASEAFQAMFGERGVPLMPEGVSPPVMDSPDKR